MSKRPITKAVFLVAGMGTRFLPATKALPKEMLPIIDKPILQYIVEEFVEAGIKDIIFVTSNGKEAIERHFDRNFELEYRLEQKGKDKEEMLASVKHIGKLANYAFVRQDKPLGDGHALLAALPFIDDDEAVAVCFGDDLIEGKTPAIGQLIDIYNEHGGCVTAVEDVGPDNVERFGIIDGEPVNDSTWRVSQFIEKPKKKDAPSTLAHIGREVVTAEYLKILQKTEPDAKGEIRIAGGFANYLEQGGQLHAKIVDGTWWDCGTKIAYAKTVCAHALKHPEIGDEMREYLKDLL